LSAGWSTGDLTRYAVLSARGSRAVIVAMAGAAAIMVSVAAPAARVLVLGAPGRVAPTVLAHGLATFAPALLGFGLVAYLSRVHYSRGAARSAAVATGAGWALVVAVDVVLVPALPPRWTVPALGVGTTAGMTVAAFWLAMSLRRAVGPGALTGTGRTLVAALSAAAVGALAGAGMASALPQVGAAASVAVTAGVGLVCALLFLAICAVLDRTTVQMLLRRRVADA